MVETEESGIDNNHLSKMEGSNQADPQFLSSGVVLSVGVEGYVGTVEEFQ